MLTAKSFLINKYVRSSGGIYKSETIGTTLEFTPNVRDAIEVSIKVT
jgi:hypothetical protein